MKKRIFIDGQYGTTGLRIYDRILKHSEIEIIELPSVDKKNVHRRAEAMNDSHLTILCLPDSAEDTTQFIKNKQVKIIDTSTTHRTAPGWIYGFPEIHGQRKSIQKCFKLANPGCYATGAIALITPLIKRKAISQNSQIILSAISGYSGGGKKLITQYESTKNLNSSYFYALFQNHKHLKEINYYTRLKKKPIFLPTISNFKHGMLVQLPFFKESLCNPFKFEDLYQIYLNYYANESFIKVFSINDDSALENGYLNPETCNNTNELHILIFGNSDRFTIIARLDNLGKGSSGAAVQNVNLMLGFEECATLM